VAVVHPGVESDSGRREGREERTQRFSTAKMRAGGRDRCCCPFVGASLDHTALSTHSVPPPVRLDRSAADVMPCSTVLRAITKGIRRKWRWSGSFCFELVWEASWLWVGGSAMNRTVLKKDVRCGIASVPSPVDEALPLPQRRVLVCDSSRARLTGAVVGSDFFQVDRTGTRVCRSERSERRETMRKRAATTTLLGLLPEREGCERSLLPPAYSASSQTLCKPENGESHSASFDLGCSACSASSCESHYELMWLAVDEVKQLHVEVSASRSCEPSSSSRPLRIAPSSFVSLHQKSNE
jgi:hypothetical protein